MRYLFIFLIGCYIGIMFRLTFCLGRDVERGELPTWNNMATRIGLCVMIILWPIVMPIAYVLGRLKLL